MLLQNYLYNKMAGYKIYTQKFVAFPYIMKKMKEKFKKNKFHCNE